MNKKGYRVSMDIFASDQYETEKQYFEFNDKLTIGEAEVFTPELAYLLSLGHRKGMYEQNIIAINLETGLEEILPGSHYRQAYVTGFAEGVDYFNKHWSLDPDTVYGPKSDHYFNDLKRAYNGNMNGDTAEELINGRNEPGWLQELNTIPLIITEKSIKKQGYYAGLVSKYRELELKHDRLRVKPDPEGTARKRRPKPSWSTLEEACGEETAMKLKLLFAEHGYCAYGTFVWTKDKVILANYLKHDIFEAKHYKRMPKQKEIMSIALNDFGTKMARGTITNALGNMPNLLKIPLSFE